MTTSNTRLRPWVGAATPNGYYEPSGLTDLIELEDIIGVHVDVDLSFWGPGDALNAGHVRAMNARGTVPILTISPSGSTPDASQLAAINNGNYDSQITANATALIGTNHMIRPLHEMNGNFNSYGQQPTAFLSAWNRIRSLWRGAGNYAPFLWTPNIVVEANTVDFTPYYPGDSACEYVGLDGYSYSSDSSNGASTFSQLFVTGTGGFTNLATIEALSPHPVLISEVGVATALSGRPTWIDDMFTTVAADPRIIGVNYWHRDVYAIDGPQMGSRIGLGMRSWRRTVTGQS